VEEGGNLEAKLILATVRYSSGVSITVEHDKLQILDVGDHRVPNESKIVPVNFHQ
jgi:hypothetical protein